MGITRTNLRKRRRENLKSLDQTYAEIQELPKRPKVERPIDPDLPGLGQFYCIPCSRYFVDQHTLEKHCTAKVHKKRLKQLKEKPYSHEDSLRAAGHGGIDNGKKLNRNKPNAEANAEPQQPQPMADGE